MGTRWADHVTPLHPQKLALTSPTGGGRSVGIVRVRTKATELLYLYLRFHVTNECVLACDAVVANLHTRPLASALSTRGWSQ